MKKDCAIQSNVCLLEVKGKEIKVQEKIMENLYHFYKILFSNSEPVSNKSICNYLKDINLPKLSMEERGLWEGELTKKEVKRRRFFFYLGFLSRIFTIHRTAGEEEGYFNSSQPLPPASQTLAH